MTRDELVQEARAAAIRHGIDPDLFVAQIQSESGFDPYATSPAGAMGIAQFMPGTAQSVGLQNPYDPVAALDASARLMSQYVSTYGNYEDALVAYNRGPGTVGQTVRAGTETAAYIARVFGAVVGKGFSDPGGGGVSQMAEPKYIQDPKTGKLVPNPRYTETSGDNTQAENLPGMILRSDGYYLATKPDQRATEAQVQAAINQKYPEGNGPSAAQLMADATSRRGQDLSTGLGYANLGENARQFNESQAFAKEKWLVDQQNTLRQLEQQDRQLNMAAAQNARMYDLERQNQQFLRDKLAVDTEFGNRAEQRATENQIFTQQATIAGIQMDQEAIRQRTNEVNAQLRQETALFNAGKAADVSMFNIDQQTKAAMFNAEGAYNAAVFNEQHGFEVAKANEENERLRRQQLIDVAGQIGELGADPGDRGQLAAFISALGPEGFGATDAGLAGADFRSDDSLVPLEASLRYRDDIRASDPHPFKANPVSFTPVTAGQATFTPAQAQQAPMPNFSGVQMPTPNTSPFVPVTVPKPGTTPLSNDAATQQFIATGVDSEPTQDFQNWDTAENRAQIPQFVLDDMIARGQIPATESGGMRSSAYLADERGPELHIPQFDAAGQRTQQIIPADATQKLMQANQTFQSNVPNAQTMGTGPQPWKNMPPIPVIDQQWTSDWSQQQVGAPADNMPVHTTGNPAGNTFNAPWMQQIRDRFPQGGQNPQFDNPAFARLPEFIRSLLPAFIAMARSGGMQQGNPPQGEGQGAPQGAQMMQGPYLGMPDDSINIPMPGTNQTIILPRRSGQRPQMPSYAEGGLFAAGGGGESIYEGLLNDTDRTRARNFLSQAGTRAAAQTGFDINRLPTPVGVSAPGTSPFLSQLVASLNALRRGVPQDYFMELAQRARPTSYSEGIVGRTR